MRKGLLLPVFLISACVPRTLTVRATADLIENGISAVYEERDLSFAKEALPGQLKLTEVLLKSDPQNRDLLKTLAEGYFGYAFLFLEEKEPLRAAAMYERSAHFGLRLLARNPAFAGIQDMQADTLSAALRKKARAKDIPGLYWTAAAWAGHANIKKNDPAALARIPRAAQMMGHVLAVAPDYQFGGADLFFGVYYAGRPRMAGGNPEKGKTHFEAALRRTKRRYLMTQYLYAKYYTIAALEEETFKTLLAEVAASDAAALPAAALPNTAAKDKSRALLEQLDDLF